MFEAIGNQQWSMLDVKSTLPCDERWLQRRCWHATADVHILNDDDFFGVGSHGSSPNRV